MLVCTFQWIPLTINDPLLAHGDILTCSLAVYGDGAKLVEVEDGTADSCVVAPGGPVTSLTVRTKSGDKLSAESAPCPVPPHLAKQPAKQSAKQSAADTAADSDSDSELMEKLQKHSPAISAAPRSRELVINYNAFPDIDSDIGPRELSNIAEEPEDEYSDSETERRQGPSVAKLDLANLYKNPLLNNNNVWKPSSTSTSTTATSTPGQKAESSQVTNSQFSAQQRLQPPPLDNANTGNKNLEQESGDTAPAPSTRWVPVRAVNQTSQNFQRELESIRIKKL